MKKILVTGASGSIGIWVLKYLLSEGKYEITALNLKSKEAYNRLKKYKKRINLIYGDVCDPVLMDALIKDHDYVIHLAGFMPPLCNLSKDFGMKIDYVGTENIVRAISFYNPECCLIFPSTTTLYEKSNTIIGVNSKVSYFENDFYSATKEKCENLIKSKLKNYMIFRIPFVLGDLYYDKAIYLYRNGETIETITNRDVAYGLVKSIEHTDLLNRKTKILSGGESCRITKEELLIKIYEVYGFSFSEIKLKIFNSCKYSGNIFKEDQKLLAELNYQNDSIDSYFMRLQREEPRLRRKLRQILATFPKKRLERKRVK